VGDVLMVDTRLVQKRLVTTCERAAKTLLHEDQLRMLAEECSELAVAASHAARYRDGARDEVIEEMADVLIMITQAQIILGITSGELIAHVDKKIARLDQLLMARLLCF